MWEIYSIGMENFSIDGRFFNVYNSFIKTARSGVYEKGKDKNRGTRGISRYEHD